MHKIKHVIRRIKEGSIAEELGIEPGDELLEIGGQEITDIFDYQYLMQDEYIEVLIRRRDGEEWLLEINKEYDEDLGRQAYAKRHHACQIWTRMTRRCI